MGKDLQITAVKVVRIILGCVFLLAALFRIFNNANATSEVLALGMPSFFTWIIVIFELLVSGCLIFNKYVKIALYGVIVFLVIAIITALIVNGTAVFASIGELFVFNATPTDILLHIMYIILAVILLTGQRR
jgi:uncharacterized membrane protein YphA (DoxX/SURF4 family)